MLSSSSPAVSEWVDAIMSQYTDEVAESDRAYVRAVLIATGEFQKPLENLAVNIIGDAGSTIDITIRGFKKRFSMRDWCTTLLGTDRDPMMDHVVDTWAQENDTGKMEIVIQLKKMVFTTRHRATTKKDDEDQPPRSSSKQMSRRDKRSRWD